MGIHGAIAVDHPIAVAAQCRGSRHHRSKGHGRVGRPEGDRIAEGQGAPGVGEHPDQQFGTGRHLHRQCGSSRAATRPLGNQAVHMGGSRDRISIRIEARRRRQDADGDSVTAQYLTVHMPRRCLPEEIYRRVGRGPAKVRGCVRNFSESAGNNLRGELAGASRPSSAHSP